MILLALLLQSSLPGGSPPGIEPAISSTPELTPLDLTQDVGDVNCRLTGDDGRTFALRLRESGGRGYRDPRTGEVSATESDVIVESNRADLFSEYEFKTAMHGGAPGYKGWAKSSTAPFGRTVDLRLSRVTPPLQRKDERLALVLDAHWEWLSLTRAVGFCDLQRIPQQPLSEAETRKFLKL